MQTLLIAVGAGIAFIIAYHTYGRWLGSKIFNLAADTVCPSERLRDDNDYVPTPKSVVFGHHFTSIAGTGPIVGPAIAVMWGWLPALLWVVFGSIFIGAVHDFGSLVVSLRNNGQTVGDIAGRVLNRRVRLLFLFVLFMALTVVLAIFGLVIAAVFKQYPSAIFPCLVQIPLAIAIGFWLHRKGKGLLLPSIIALVVMYLTVVFGDQNTRLGISFFDDTIGGALHTFNAFMSGQWVITWVAILLVYSYVASVLPVWTLLQPRDYINSLQLISALGLVVLGLVVAAFAGGAPPVEGAQRMPLEIVAPVVHWSPEGAPLIFPFLFITIACGAISGFHCLVSSGTSSKQLKKETDARFVGYGSMLTEGFLATIVILACVAGLGLGTKLAVQPIMLTSNPPPIATSNAGKSTVEFTLFETRYRDNVGKERLTWVGNSSILEFPGESGERFPAGTAVTSVTVLESGLVATRSSAYDESKLKRASDVVTDEVVLADQDQLVDMALVGPAAFNTRYESWTAAGGLARTVGAFVDGSANFLAAMGIPHGVAIALMGVLVASFAGTTLDTACRLQRYVVQELAATFAPQVSPTACAACGYDLSFNQSGACPECGAEPGTPLKRAAGTRIVSMNPIVWLTNKHAATIFAIVIAAAIAAMPGPGKPWSWVNAGGGGLILWPMFGATNQLLGGLAFLVISFWLWRRKKPVWFAVLPMIFMLCMPLLAMGLQLFWGEGSKASWWDQKNYVLIFIGLATLALEIWMIVEALLLWPKVKGVLEQQLPGNVEPQAA